MKTRFFTAAAIVAVLAIGMTSCTEKIEMPGTMAAASATKGADVILRAQIAGTKSSAESAVKDEWNNDDYVIVANQKIQSLFRSNGAGKVAEFIPAAGDAKSLEGSKVYSVFPNIARLDAAGQTFSFANQNGSLANIQAYSLMTGEGQVSNSLAKISFESQVAVIRLHDVIFHTLSGASIRTASISGEGISEKYTVSLAEDGVKVEPKGDSNTITVNNPNLDEDVYIAFIPSQDTKAVEIVANDNMGGHFFYTLSLADGFQAGQTYTLEGDIMEGGYEITFCPIVMDWE